MTFGEAALRSKWVHSDSSTTWPRGVSTNVEQKAESSSLSDLTANPLILLKWYYFLEAKLLSLFKGLKISMMPSPTGC